MASAGSWSLGGYAAADSAVTTAEYNSRPGQASSHVVQAAYSTGQAGHRLKWLPTRSGTTNQATRSPSLVKSAQYNAPSPARVAARGSVDAFNDPFGRTRTISASGRHAPGEPVTDDAIKATPPAPELLPVPKPLEGESTERRQKVTAGPELTKELLATADPDEPYDCSSSEDLRELSEVKLDITPEEALPAPCKMVSGEFQERNWAPTTFMWKASGLCHKPAYFEQVHLERYGHATGPYTQPLISAAHFFLTVPILPYKMGLYPDGECIYTLGYYRPGSCAPYMLDPLPLSVRAGLVQAGVVTGLGIIIP